MNKDKLKTPRWFWPLIAFLGVVSLVSFWTAFNMPMPDSLTPYERTATSMQGTYEVLQGTVDAEQTAMARNIAVTATFASLPAICSQFIPAGDLIYNGGVIDLHAEEPRQMRLAPELADRTGMEILLAATAQVAIGGVSYDAETVYAMDANAFVENTTFASEQDAMIWFVVYPTNSRSLLPSYETFRSNVLSSLEGMGCTGIFP